MFGSRIKELRKEHKDTQKQLADYLGVSRQTIHCYEVEMYEPDLNLLYRIASKYNVSTDYLLGKTNIKNYKDKLYIDKKIRSLDEENPVLKKVVDTFANIIENNQDSEKLQILDDILELISKLL